MHTVALPLLLPLLSLPLNDGGGLSSFDFRFSARGGKNAVGEVDGVLLVLLPELLDGLEILPAVVVVVVILDVVFVDVRDALPFALAFRSLLWTYFAAKDYYFIIFAYIADI